MGNSSISLLHLVFPLEETMTFFLCGFKHFHSPLPVYPARWPPWARTGKVRPAEVSRSGARQPPTDGVADEGGHLVDVQLPHKIDPMGLDGFDAQSQAPG